MYAALGKSWLGDDRYLERATAPKVSVGHNSLGRLPGRLTARWNFCATKTRLLPIAARRKDGMILARPVIIQDSFRRIRVRGRIPRLSTDADDATFGLQADNVERNFCQRCGADDYSAAAFATS